MLIRPRMYAIDIDGQQDLVISRQRNPMSLDVSYESNVAATVTNFSFIGLTQRTRIGRFIYAMKFVWKHCK